MYSFDICMGRLFVLFRFTIYKHMLSDAELPSHPMIFILQNLMEAQEAYKSLLSVIWEYLFDYYEQRNVLLTAS